MKYELAFYKTFTCRNCGGGDRGRVVGEVSLSLNRTVTCMVLKANDRRTSCPCHDEFRGPRSDYVRQYCLRTISGLPLHGDMEHYWPEKSVADLQEDLFLLIAIYFVLFCIILQNSLGFLSSSHDVKSSENTRRHATPYPHFRQML
ncbi:uncharacterized protein TNCV_3834571 [Trichonephila clavipes]|nr:uncharacterized protein TNCV_3834571 [Trichonephila clavipes]